MTDNNTSDNTQNDNLTLLLKFDADIYKLWFIFRKLPMVHYIPSTKYKYEWTVSDQNDYFVIRDMNSKLNLLNITKWGIYTNTNDTVKIKNFLDTLIYYSILYNNVNFYKTLPEDTLDESYQFYISEYNKYSSSLNVWSEFLYEL